MKLDLFFQVHFNRLLFSRVICQFEAAHETGQEFCGIALWDCFPDASSSFIGCLFSFVSSPKQSHNLIQPNSDPVLSAILKWLTAINREIKTHVYGKRQTSDSSWEFLRIENKRIKTVLNNSYG